MPIIITQEIAEQRVQNKCNEKNYTCSGFVYIGSLKTYLPLKCHCGNEWNTTNYSNFVNNGKGCPECKKKTLKTKLSLSQEEAEQRVKAKCKEMNYTCSSFVYIGNTETYLPLKCHCGNEWDSTSYVNFVSNGHGCSICGKLKSSENRKISQEEAEQRVKAKCKEMNYTCSSFVYIGNAETYLPLKCHCGNEWDSTCYYSFINHGRGCPRCGGSEKISQEEAEQRVKAKCKEMNYTCSEFVYIGKEKTYLSLKCHCGNEWDSTTYGNFIYAGRGCSKCGLQRLSDKFTLSQEEAEQRVKAKCKEMNYTCSEFVYINNAETYLPLKCHCGNEWDSTNYANFVSNNRGCPKCGLGEANCISKEIDPMLGENVISEQRFDDCRDKKQLPFDRFVPYLNMLLEYDGRQHFDKSNAWYTKSGVKRDNIKTEYAINNGYNFIRIAYYEDHVAVLESFLKLIEENPGKQIVQIYGEVQII